MGIIYCYYRNDLVLLVLCFWWGQMVTEVLLRSPWVCCWPSNHVYCARHLASRRRAGPSTCCTAPWWRNCWICEHKISHPDWLLKTKHMAALFRELHWYSVKVDPSFAIPTVVFINDIICTKDIAHNMLKRSHRIIFSWNNKRVSNTNHALARD